MSVLTGRISATLTPPPPLAILPVNFEIGVEGGPRLERDAHACWGDHQLAEYRKPTDSNLCSFRLLLGARDSRPVQIRCVYFMLVIRRCGARCCRICLCVSTVFISLFEVVHHFMP